MTKAYLLTENNILSNAITEKLNKDGIKLFCGNYYDITELLNNLNKIKPDILIIDIIINNYLFGEKIKVLLQAKPDYKTIVIINDEKYFHVFDSIEHNIKGFLCAKNDITELLSAINIVLKEKSYLSTSISENLIHRTNETNPFFKYKSLSEENKQIFHMLLKCNKLMTIGTKFGFTEKTAGERRKYIYNLFKVKNVVELHDIAVKHGIVNPE